MISTDFAEKITKTCYTNIISGGEASNHFPDVRKMVNAQMCRPFYFYFLIFNNLQR